MRKCVSSICGKIFPPFDIRFRARSPNKNHAIHINNPTQSTLSVHFHQPRPVSTTSFRTNSALSNFSHLTLNCVAQLPRRAPAGFIPIWPQILPMQVPPSAYGQLGGLLVPAAVPVPASVSKTEVGVMA